MKQIKFIDEAYIEVCGGHGGSGSSSMRREKFIEFGGPDGGNGGRGGSIYITVDSNINTLIEYSYAHKYIAENGQSGKGSGCSGKSGRDINLYVPLGTTIYDCITRDVIVDLKFEGQYFCLAKGGDGGFGNLHFKNSINRSTRRKTTGFPGEFRKLKLEMKVLADVGLFGFPNVGKSTFLSVVSNAKPKISDYPFTTLYPVLGQVKIEYEKGFFIADIPGIISGASNGVGLGHHFLRHLQRTNLILHLIDATSLNEDINIVENTEALVLELKKYDEQLYKKPRWIVINKIDKLEKKNRDYYVKKFIKSLNWKEPFFEISSLTKEGCMKLCNAIRSTLK